MRPSATLGALPAVVDAQATNPATAAHFPWFGLRSAPNAGQALLWAMSHSVVSANEYIIREEVGRGTSGVVYRAQRRATSEPVALKLLDASIATDPKAQLAEAQLLTSLDHPAIVRIVASGVLPGDKPFIAMQWLDGEDLSQRQARAPLKLIPALRLMVRVAEGLQAAHAAGIVHRDIKPANIFLLSSGDDANPAPKLLDFGAAIQVASAHTADGAIIGTPAYMSPEQVRGDSAVDQRSDIYSLGATLYELIAGHPPHQGSSYLATLARVTTARPRRLLEIARETPPALDELVHRMIATQPDLRPADMAEVIEELSEIISSVTRGSIADAEPRSMRLGSSASRLLTTLVARGFSERDQRDEALAHLRSLGTEAVALGQDSLVAHFGARRSLGNEAEGALRLGRKLSKSNAAVGVATGRAFIPIMDLTRPIQAIGEVVDRATALSRSANHGQVLADETTCELGRQHYDFKPAGVGHLEVGARRQRSRLPGEVRTPFVGRDTELARIATAYERAAEGSRAVVVSISGAPGIGKTRLQREAMSRLQTRGVDVRRVGQRSDAYGKKRALGAALDIMRSLLGIQKGDDEIEAHAVIERALAPGLDAHLQARIPTFARLLAQQQFDAEAATRGLRDLLWLFMTNAVEQQLAHGPIAIVTEDLQWADPESVEWLDHLLGRASNLPLFLLVTSRPEFWLENPNRFSGRTHVKLALHPISSQAARQITASVTDGKLTEAAVESIVRQAGGSPLFAEELSRLALIGTKVTHAPTIEAAIQVSLDALSQPQRDALGYLSVLGQTGRDAALGALGFADADQVLQELYAAGVLIPNDPLRFAGVPEWQFKHGLVRDVVYDTLNEDHRRQLHDAAAGWLERIGEDATVIARHYDLAQRPERAAEFWAVAATHALTTNALGDALNMAERALAFSQNDRQGFARAQILDQAWSRLDARGSDRETAVSALEEHTYDEASRTYALGARARYDAARGQGVDVDARLAEARDAANQLGLRDEEVRCSAELAARLAFAGRFDDAEREAARLLSLAEARELRAAAVDAWQTLAIVHQSRGELAAALEARRNAAAAAREAELRERESVLTTNLGFALTTLGARRESREMLFGGLHLAEAIGSQGARRHAHMLLLGWSASFGSDQELDAQLADMRAEADAAAAGTWTAPARENLGVLFYRGLELLGSTGPTQRENARALLQLSAEAYRATKNRDLLPVALGMWARAELSCGNASTALDLAKAAAESLESGAPSLLNESPVYLALHDAYAQLGQPTLARHAIEQAMAPLEKRLEGMSRTGYARPFLTALTDNSTLVSLADSYGVLPDPVRSKLNAEAG